MIKKTEKRGPSTYMATIKGISPYSQGRFHETPKLEGELHQEYEERTWRERMHVNQDGNVFIPPLAFKNALSAAAKYLSMPIPGQGKKNYTKKIESGVLCFEPIVLKIKKDEVHSLRLFVPSDGVRGGTKRVVKIFPCIQQWGGELRIDVVDPIVSEEVLREHLRAAGSYIGIGVSRPSNNGYFGRFMVEELVRI